MEQIKIEIIKQLDNVRNETTSDFSAFATLRQNDQIIQWNYVSGNTNNRYKNMIGRPGKGLAGFVIRADRAMVIDESTPNYLQKRLDYPIMLAENLQAAVAVPVKADNKTVGVLVIGSRTAKTYTSRELKNIDVTAEALASAYHKRKDNISIK